MDAVLKAIAEPRRRAILELVSDCERSAGEIADAFDVTRPAVSQHLGVLRKAGLVSERREGTRRYYRAREQGFAEIARFVERYWKTSLDRLKVAAEEDERRKGNARN